MLVTDFKEMRILVIAHVTEGNTMPTNDCCFISTSPSSVSVSRLATERAYLYGAEPVFVRIDLERFGADQIIDIGGCRSALFLEDKDC